MKSPRHILAIIVFAQFCCVSLWFAGNGVMNDLVVNFNLQESALGHLTSAVQLGFIAGTLIFAILTIADRFPPSKVFFVCALIGAIFNLGIIWKGNGFLSILVLRFFTGFFLAGIYPVGMKIAADYFEKGLGKSLGFIVGALVIGTSFPHLLKNLSNLLSWKFVLINTSALAVLGGVLMVFLVPDGPFRKPGQKIDLGAFYKVFENSEFRSAAFGYFGHMWELYAFWAFVPIMIKTYALSHPENSFNIPFLSFLVIGIGGLSCVLGAYLAQKFGTRRIAFFALFASCICCLVSPWIFTLERENIFVGFLILWGMVVIADSPLFSTLVAQNTSPEMKGTALTIVNCIGFAITIISIQLINVLREFLDINDIFMILAIGPIFGLIALKKVPQSLD
ncbi:MFS transporter [Namhaeicola litoreus]|uniref:Nitrate/nitrite transporter n=1 Tax=Namhaeicola litoreus TaxID=1052145 RepID=A0ABW3XYL3_9FLAO